MKRFAFTKNRLIGFVCSALLPVMAIVLGCLMLVKDVVLNISLAIVYFLIPLIVAGLLGWCIFSNRKAWKKSVLSVVILALFLILFFFSSLLVGWTQVKRYEEKEAAQQYSLLKSESGLMPDLAELGNPAKIEYYNIFSFFFIFSNETDGLICSYTQEDYELQKARLDTAYIFQTETIMDDYSNCEPTIEIDGYQFRMLSVERYELYYPKNIFLIGYSDDAREIVYIEFYDSDLDYISSLKDFIMDECSWKYIR